MKTVSTGTTTQGWTGWIIATYSVGFEHIDLQGAVKSKIAVAYTGINSDRTADIASSEQERGDL